jgi:hypothetical protein
MQLRFTSFVVINLRRDLHPQECAHAGRTKGKRPMQRTGRFQILPDPNNKSVNTLFRERPFSHPH